MLISIVSALIILLGLWMVVYGTRCLRGDRGPLIAIDWGLIIVGLGDVLLGAFHFIQHWPR